MVIGLSRTVIDLEVTKGPEHTPNTIRKTSLHFIRFNSTLANWEKDSTSLCSPTGSWCRVHAIRVLVATKCKGTLFVTTCYLARVQSDAYTAGQDPARRCFQSQSHRGGVHCEYVQLRDVNGLDGFKFLPTHAMCHKSDIAHQKNKH